ncbi:MAG: pyocin knob domain-containing protein [Tannerellaceae bacterium]|nr:pyocin knob domain-containing protein [Tannerellaceae bacterium]
MEKIKTNLGKIAFTLRGLYNENEAYEKLDVIYHGGSSYVVVTPFSGIEPSPESEHVMLIAERGEKGDPFTFEELTEEQKQELKGDPGNGFVIWGYYENLLELEALVTEPQAGDAYGVGEEHPYEIYVFDAVNGVWRNYGRLEGPQGARGTDGKSAYEIAVEQGFEGTVEEWLNRQVINGENPEAITIEAPALTLKTTEDLHLQSGGKVLYQDEEIAVKSDLTDLVTNEALQEKIDQLGAVTYIALITDGYEELETLENLRPGAIALVKEEESVDQNRYKEYIWMNEEDGWEFLGYVEAQHIDIDNYYDKKEVDSKLFAKVSMTGEDTIAGSKTFNENVYSGKSFFAAKRASGDGKVGAVLRGDGTVVIQGAVTPSILFLRGDETSENAYITNNAEGVINFVARNGVKANGGNVFYHRGRIGSTDSLDNLVGDGKWSVVNNLTAPQAYGMLIQYNAVDNGNAPGVSESWYSQLFYANYDSKNSTTIADIYYRRRINVNAWSAWTRMAVANETPQFGKYKSLTSITGIIELGDLYDIRRETIGDGVPVSINGFSNGVDGMEYRISCNNAGQQKCVLNLPTGDAYQSDDTTWTIEAGKVGVLGILYVFGKYIMTVIV